ncbi:MAG TPA: alpha/beta hydrolase [Candidatus Binataceae bacterium]|nr:alpha/beta hydrolase [Candidatus Binataceae bacterium]
MPKFERNGISLHYEEYGSGHPLLLFAPGGMRSSIEFWHRSPFDPTVEFAPEFRVIAMDQRNAGDSRAPVGAGDGWETYTSDHLALLDHLGIQRSHIMGGCIGSSYCLGLIKLAPARISAAVLQNPIGLSPENRPAFIEMFDGWAADLKKRRSDIPNDAGLAEFRDRMYGGDFVFSVTRDFVRSCRTPMMILAGDDLYHPAAIAQEIAELAPHADLVMKWKTPDAVQAAVAKTREFLRANR